MSSEPSAASEPNQTNTPANPPSGERPAPAEPETRDADSAAAALPPSDPDESAADTTATDDVPASGVDGTCGDSTATDMVTPGESSQPADGAVTSGHSMLSGENSASDSETVPQAAAEPDATDIEPPQAAPAESPVAEVTGPAGQPSAANKPRTKILIGSRRNRTVDAPPSPQPVASPQPEVAEADRPIETETPEAPSIPETAVTPQTPVQPPSVRDPLGDDLQQELESAIESTSMEDILAAAAVRHRPNLWKSSHITRGL